MKCCAVECTGRGRCTDWSKRFVDSAGCSGPAEPQNRGGCNSAHFRCVPGKGCSTGCSYELTRSGSAMGRSWCDDDFVCIRNWSLDSCRFGRHASHSRCGEEIKERIAQTLIAICVYYSLELFTAFFSRESFSLCGGTLQSNGCKKFLFYTSIAADAAGNESPPAVALGTNESAGRGL